MSAALTRSDVHAIAALARLELDEQEVELFSRQLAEILEYAQDLQRIDTAGVPPTASVGVVHSTDRLDEVRPSIAREDALANAPDAATDAGFFRVPRVIG
jgi:aspartyl-tRNA(Asn)/glutamyl-tRNA(Gln) amidotransferase subunit C